MLILGQRKNEMVTIYEGKTGEVIATVMVCEVKDIHNNRGPLVKIGYSADKEKYPIVRENAGVKA